MPISDKPESRRCPSCGACQECGAHPAQPPIIVYPQIPCVPYTPSIPANPYPWRPYWQVNGGSYTSDSNWTYQSNEGGNYQ